MPVRLFAIQAAILCEVVTHQGLFDEPELDRELFPGQFT